MASHPDMKPLSHLDSTPSYPHASQLQSEPNSLLSESNNQPCIDCRDSPIQDTGSDSVSSDNDLKLISQQAVHPQVLAGDGASHLVCSSVTKQEPDDDTLSGCDGRKKQEERGRGVEEKEEVGEEKKNGVDKYSESSSTEDSIDKDSYFGVAADGMDGDVPLQLGAPTDIESTASRKDDGLNHVWQNSGDGHEKTDIVTLSELRQSYSDQAATGTSSRDQDMHGHMSHESGNLKLETDLAFRLEEHIEIESPTNMKSHRSKSDKNPKYGSPESVSASSMEATGSEGVVVGVATHESTVEAAMSWDMGRAMDNLLQGKQDVPQDTLAVSIISVQACGI